jgi:hypothetical protein
MPKPPTITTAPLVGRTRPVRLPPGVLQEHQDSGVIEEDLQTGTITEQWVIQGNPWEALNGPGMQGFLIKEPHQWYADPEEHKYAYLVKRRFEHMARSSASDERLTLATFVWQLRPCPFAFEEEETGALISHISWWSLDDTPQPLHGGQVGIAVMHPTRMLIRRYPAIQLNYTKLERIMAEHGKTNGVPFAEQTADYWLFQNVRTKMLYGDALTKEGTYEVTLYFLGDPIRKHKLWRPLEVGTTGVLMEPMTVDDLPSVHKINRVIRYPHRKDVLCPFIVVAKCMQGGR